MRISREQRDRELEAASFEGEERLVQIREERDRELERIQARAKKRHSTEIGKKAWLFAKLQPGRTRTQEEN